MTVADLLLKLCEFPRDREVVSYDGEYDSYIADPEITEHVVHEVQNHNREVISHKSLVRVVL
jgi:hypothetical protein